MHCCARCGREVYVTEAKIACNKIWHSFCFSCYKCRKLLEGCRARVYNGELFCNACYNSCCLPTPCCSMRCSDPRKLDCDSCCNTCVSCKALCGPCDTPCKDICRTSCDPCSRCCIFTRDPCSPCCELCNRCCEYSDLCCEPCDPCQTRCDPCEQKFICTCCCKPIIVRTRSKPQVCFRRADTYCLQPTCIEKKCNNCIALCLDDYQPPSCMSRYRSCSPCCGSRRCSPVPCCRSRPVSACTVPTPREISNYYNRNHKKCCETNCDRCGTCKGCGKACNPCAIIDCTPPKNCCPPKLTKGPPPNSCPPTNCCPPNNCCPPSNCFPPPKCCPSPRSCTPTPNCCPPPKCCPPSRCSILKPCCSPKCSLFSPCADSCCEPCLPYYPPPRKPICYPPMRCCEPPPPERICYFPGSPPVKYCSCCASKPCNCDLNYRRRQAICHNTPRCRRCGRKVFAAEKIMASGGAFHSCCFSCYCCRKPLEVTNVCEAQGEIYCKCCHCKFFGPQGYGYGASLQTTT